MKKLIGLLLFIIIVSQAQTLDCAELMTQSLPTPPKLETVEARMTTTTQPSQEAESVTTTIYQVMDAVNRRIYMEMSLPDNNKTITRYAGGKGTITMMIADEAITSPFPQEASGQLEKLFDNILGNQFLLPENYEVISCDGVQEYAGLIKGEQITVRGDIPNLGNLEMHVIIDKEQQLFGSVMDMPQLGQTLSVMKDFNTEPGEMPKHVEINIYSLETNTATLTTTMQLDYLSINQPVDETLFTEQ
jgi:hypothetical protein